MGPRQWPNPKLLANYSRSKRKLESGLPPFVLVFCCITNHRVVWFISGVSAPTALKAHNVAEGKTITSYPAMRAQLEEGGTLDSHFFIQPTSPALFGGL